MGDGLVAFTIPALNADEIPDERPIGSDTARGKRLLSPRITLEQSKTLIVHPGAGRKLKVRNEWRWSDFVIKEVLGYGAYAQVMRAREITTGYPVALKVMKLPHIIDCIPNIVQEVELQSRQSHSNIVRIYGYFRTDKHLVLVLEYCSGGILHAHRLNQEQLVFTEAQAAKYCFQIANGLIHCHKHHVCHRDLKPENILLDRDGNIKLADFGWAAEVKNRQRRSTMAGTYDFMAPEVWKRRPYGLKADVWSLGCILYELLYGVTPYQVDIYSIDPENELTVEERQALWKKALYRALQRNEVKFPKENGISNGAKLLIKGLLASVPEKRMSLYEVVSDPWVRKHNRPAKR